MKILSPETLIYTNYKTSNSITQEYLTFDTNNRFEVFHYPHQWQMTQSGEWLPTLTESQIIPGCNYVSGEVGNENISLHLPFMKAKGAIYIDPTDQRLDQFKNFITHTTINTKLPNQEVYTQKFYHFGCGISTVETVTPLGEVINISLRIATDSIKYEAFRRHLINSGIIDEITKETRQKLLETHTSNENHEKAKLLIQKDLNIKPSIPKKIP